MKARVKLKKFHKLNQKEKFLKQKNLLKKAHKNGMIKNGDNRNSKTKRWKSKKIINLRLKHQNNLRNKVLENKS